MTLHYTLTPDPVRHRYSVLLALPAGNQDHLTLQMPVWTPGSYVLREYAGRVSELSASSSKGLPLPVEQTGKARWRIDLLGASSEEEIEVRWTVFAFSQGIHDAWIDSDRGFVNPPAALLFPSRCADGPVDCCIAFDAPGWRVHSALDAVSPNEWTARSIDELLDSPFALTPESEVNAHILDLTVCGTPHRIVITGAASLNRDRIARDLSRTFEAAIRFWDPKDARAPFDRYLLVMHLAPGAYGGLEHAAGTMLLEDPENFPAAHESEPPKGYSEFLILAAHEYFHAWLVKRLKPSAFLPYDLSRENPSHDLWIFEGVTSHFESRIPLLAGVIDRQEARRRFAERLNAAFGREGFDRMSLSESGFCAWTKLYRPTQDSFYSQVSYYTKGALAALLIDAELRRRTKGASDLAKFLAGWFARVREAIARGEWPGLPDRGIAGVIREVTGEDLTAFIERLVEGRGDRALWEKAVGEALAEQGLALEPDPAAPAALRLAGLRVKPRSGRPFASDVPSASPAFAAGIFSGDEIVAVDGERAALETINRQIERARGRKVTVHFFRGARLLSGALDLTRPLAPEFLALLPQRVVPAGDADRTAQKSVG